MINAELYRGLQDQRRLDRWVLPVCLLLMAGFGTAVWVLDSITREIRLADEAPDVLQLLYIMTLCLTGLYTAYRSGDDLSREIREGTLDLLKITSMSRGSIVWGKLLASLIPGGIAVAATLPFTLLALSLDGGLLGYALEFYLLLAPITLVFSGLFGMRVASAAPRGDGGGGQAAMLLGLCGMLMFVLSINVFQVERADPSPAGGFLTPFASFIDMARSHSIRTWEGPRVELPGSFLTVFILGMLSTLLYRGTVSDIDSEVSRDFPHRSFLALVLLAAFLTWNRSDITGMHSVAASVYAWQILFLSGGLLTVLPSREVLKQAVYQDRPCGLYASGRWPHLKPLGPLLLLFAVMIAPWALLGSDMNYISGLTFLLAFLLSWAYLSIAHAYRLWVDLKPQFVIVGILVVLFGLACLGLFHSQIGHAMVLSPATMLPASYESGDDALRRLLLGCSVAMFWVLACQYAVRRRVREYERRRDR